MYDIYIICTRSLRNKWTAVKCLRSRTRSLLSCDSKKCFNNSIHFSKSIVRKKSLFLFGHKHFFYIAIGFFRIFTELTLEATSQSSNRYLSIRDAKFDVFTVNKKILHFFFRRRIFEFSRRS